MIQLKIDKPNLDMYNLAKEIIVNSTKSGKHCPICHGGINEWGHIQLCYDLQAWAKSVIAIGRLYKVGL